MRSVSPLADRFAWYSTPESVKHGTASAFAIVEALMAVWLYWEIAAWHGDQRALWLAVVAVPLLLLRSDASVKLGVKSISKYVDEIFIDIGRVPPRFYWSFRFWSAVLVCAGAEFSVSWLLSYLCIKAALPMPEFAIGIAAGYVITQIALGIAAAFAARGMVTIAAQRTSGKLIALILIAVAQIGAWAAGAGWQFILGVAAAMIAACVVAIAKSYDALSRAATRGNLGGMYVARAVAQVAPWQVAIFLPGVFLTAWLRSVGTRIAATICHPLEGMKAWSENWWRTVVCTDLCTLPEIMPGYERQDPLNTRFIQSPRERARFGKVLAKYLYLQGIVILVLPAYIYRLTIKSTCWAYLPVSYIVSMPDLARRPQYFQKLLWSDPREWFRRVLALVAVIGIVDGIQTGIGHGRLPMPSSLIGPYEYIFLIDFSQWKVWQWFNLGACVATGVLLWYSMDLKFLNEEAKSDSELTRKRDRRLMLLETIVRIRNNLTWLFIGVLVLHAMLMLVPKAQCITPGAHYFFASIYKDKLPAASC